MGVGRRRWIKWAIEENEYSRFETARRSECSNAAWGRMRVAPLPSFFDEMLQRKLHFIKI